MRLCTLAVTLTLLPATTTSAATWYVTPDGTGDVPTIQAGVDSAAAGDEVVLASGAYTGAGNRGIVFHGQAITVRSEASDPATCTIDCEGLAQGFYVGNTDDGVVLEGLTVINGIANYGGGVYANANCVLRRCVFSSCVAVVGGGALIDSGASVEECSFLDNTGYGDGGGVTVSNTIGGFATFTGCTFAGNTTTGDGGGLNIEDGYAILQDCLIANNTARDGAGIAVTSFTNAQIDGCTITENGSTGVLSAAGLYINEDENTVAVTNCIISFSTSGAAVINYSSNGATAACTDIYGNAGGDWTPDFGSEGTLGNISADPLYCDAGSGDYSIRSDSPCAPGASVCGLIGALAVGCGDVSVERLSWGRIKDGYR